MVVSKVPEKFLNLPRLALMNAALGVVSIISQVNIDLISPAFYNNYLFNKLWIKNINRLSR